MRSAIAAGAFAVAITTAAGATAQTTVTVLKLDIGAGVDPALVEVVQTEIDGQATRAGLIVQKGATNLTDTAAIAGCSTKDPACFDQIIVSLGVGELVYGTIDRSMSGNRVTIARVRQKAKPLEVAIDVPIGSAELQRDALAPPLSRLFPVIGPVTDDGLGGGGGGGGAVTGPVDRGGGKVDTANVLTIAGLSLGGALTIAGVLMWTRVASLQGDIDDAPDSTLSDVLALQALEDRAERNASRGNFLVGFGLVIAGGTATWWYLRERKKRREASTPAAPPVGPSITVAPWLAPDAGGVTFTMR